MGKLDELRVVDPHNTEIVSGYREPRLVGINEIMPIVPVTKLKGSYTEYGPDASVIHEGLETPYGTPRKRIDMSIAKGEFEAVKVGIEVPIYDDELDEAADPSTLEEKKSKLGMSVIQLGQEKTIADYVQNAANFDASAKEALTGTARWDDYVNSDPVADVIRWIAAQELVHDVETDELAVGLGPTVWNTARLHPKVKMPTTGGGLVPANLEYFSGLVGAPVKVLRGKHAITFDPKEPRNTVFARLWGKIALVFRPLTKPEIDAPLWGAVITVNGSTVVKDYREERIDATIKAVAQKWGLHVRSNKRAFLATTVTN